MKYYFLSFIALFLFSCTNSSTDQQQNKHKTTSTINRQQNIRHIIYLHGRIVELQGKAAFSKEHGKYELDSILAVLGTDGAVVLCELRPENTKVEAYAQRVSRMVDSLIDAGTPAGAITVIGASKGAIIAAAVSDRNVHPVNYVLMGGNNDAIERQYDWHFHGRILGIYDGSDTVAGKDYAYWKERSPDVIAFEQVALKVNLGHGFLYRPLQEWVVPALKWSRREGL